MIEKLKYLILKFYELNLKFASDFIIEIFQKSHNSISTLIKGRENDFQKIEILIREIFNIEARLK